MSKVISIRPSKGNESLLTDIAELARQDNRNMNNYIETVLLAHVRKNEAKLKEMELSKNRKLSYG